MAYWLIKTEPGTWSWGDQCTAEDRTTHWDGVKNHLANKHLKAMKMGDLCYFYHSVKQREIVGVVKIVKEFEPDPNLPDTPWGHPYVQAVSEAQTPVSLQDCKTIKGLEKMILLRNSRLSVQPVSEKEWDIVTPKLHLEPLS